MEKGRGFVGGCFGLGFVCLLWFGLIFFNFLLGEAVGVKGGYGGTGRSSELGDMM